MVPKLVRNLYNTSTSNQTNIISLLTRILFKLLHFFFHSLELAFCNINFLGFISEKRFYNLKVNKKQYVVNHGQKSAVK